jgi:UDP-3-O-[3-hydroxymyristoyl] N-acetylglucosamine deacetylase / 3-hydroxyacyl-[acyl-carrier-protein] dehydratase
MSADNVKWRRPVLPGDTLFIETEILKMRGSIGQTRCRCLVNGEVVSEAELKFALLDRTPFRGRHRRQEDLSI